MADKWHTPVSRVCETCGSAFSVQYHTTRRSGGGRYCSQKCNPRIDELNKSRVALAIGPKRAEVDSECITCGGGFKTRVKNIARGGGRFCSRSCNPAYSRRFQPAEKWRRHNLKRNYGLTIGEFEDMRKAQQGRCAICRSLPDEPHGVLVVDHCHMSDCVRQLLCNNCNMAVGLLRDDPVTATRLAAYLLRYNPDETDAKLALAIIRESSQSEGLA